MNILLGVLAAVYLIVGLMVIVYLAMLIDEKINEGDDE